MTRYATIKQAADYVKVERVAPAGLTPVQSQRFICGD